MYVDYEIYTRGTHKGAGTRIGRSWATFKPSRTDASSWGCPIKTI